jgi:FKBP-type peptidyl-prolyl cis-trans isomerase
MKKTILAILLIMAVCVSASLSQTGRDREGGRMTKIQPRTKQKIRKKKRKVIRKKIVRKKVIKKMENTSNSNAVTTESGLTYIITKPGDGAQIKAGDNVIVNYTGLLTNGQKFDSSLDRGETFSFPVGAGA